MKPDDDDETLFHLFVTGVGSSSVSHHSGAGGVGSPSGTSSMGASCAYPTPTSPYNSLYGKRRKGWKGQRKEVRRVRGEGRRKEGKEKKD